MTGIEWFFTIAFAVIIATVFTNWVTSKPEEQQTIIVYIGAGICVLGGFIAYKLDPSQSGLAISFAALPFIGYGLYHVIVAWYENTHQPEPEPDPEPEPPPPPGPPIEEKIEELLKQNRK